MLPEIQGEIVKERHMIWKTYDFWKTYDCFCFKKGCGTLLEKNDFHSFQSETISDIPKLYNIGMT